MWCTDGILFVVDSVDIERMEEAKMELMRTAKCPDNQGVPVLILANKQDLPGARNPKELEKLLGLHELLYPAVHLQSISTPPTGNVAGCAGSTSNMNTFGKCMNPMSQESKSFGYISEGSFSREGFTQKLSIQLPAPSATTTVATIGIKQADSNDGIINNGSRHTSSLSSTQGKNITYEPSPTLVATSPNATTANSMFLQKKLSETVSYSAAMHQYKGWYIQPACAITGEGLQEGLEVLYEMILKRRKLNKTYKRKR